MSPRIWQHRIQDILDAAGEIGSFIAGKTFDEFRSNAMALKGVVADLAIIGEAARHVPNDIVAAHPEVPWPLMRAMRNRIIHVYFGIDPKVVWTPARTTCRFWLIH